MAEVYFIGDNVELTLKRGECVTGKITEISEENSRVCIGNEYFLNDKEYAIHSFIDCVNIGEDDDETCLFVKGAR